MFETHATLDDNGWMVLSGLFGMLSRNGVVIWPNDSHLWIRRLRARRGESIHRSVLDA
jgi:hypothetical protein